MPVARELGAERARGSETLGNMKISTTCLCDAKKEKLSHNEYLITTSI